MIDHEQFDTLFVSGFVDILKKVEKEAGRDAMIGMFKFDSIISGLYQSYKIADLNLESEPKEVKQKYWDYVKKFDLTLERKKEAAKGIYLIDRV